MNVLPLKQEFQRDVAMNGLQARLARMALKIGFREMAELTGVALATIQRIERDDETVKTLTIRKVRAALEREGITFIDNGEQGPGIRFKPRGKRRTRK